MSKDPDDFDNYPDDECGNCGGEGYTYDCIDGCCENPDEGCDLCARRCDWCNPPKPRPVQPGPDLGLSPLGKILAEALERDNKP